MSELIYVDAANKSLNKYNEELCGDKVKIKRNNDSFTMVLADGLGSGVKANILATLTSTIISEMINDGAELTDVVETIVSTLPECKERKIAYSTFSILQIFYNQQAILVEYDNPELIILRDNEPLEIKRQVMNISQRKIKVSQFKVQKNDCLIMFSDGIIHAGIGQVLNFGWDHQDVQLFLQTYIKEKYQAKDIVNLLLANVNNLYAGNPGDDSTVACAKIIPFLETIVMVGPPKDLADDQRIVLRLLGATGKKICCGGTTSKIVANYLHQDILIDLDQVGYCDVPPIGKIKGIDLVTEGVLTLQKANKYLAKGVSDETFLSELSKEKNQDGAMQLVTMLTQQCSKITFLIGCSDNPAHKKIAYSTISLTNKITLIEEMQEKLQKLGKIVNIELN